MLGLGFCFIADRSDFLRSEYKHDGNSVKKIDYFTEYMDGEKHGFTGEYMRGMVVVSEWWTA